MQDIAAIVRQPILTGLLLSITIHGMVLCSRPLYTPAHPQMETGRTVVQLTLLPSIQKLAEPTEMAQPPLEEEPHTRPESVPSPVPVPVPTPEPAPAAPTAEIEKETASSDIDAVPEPSKGITSEAATAGAFRPTYPRISRTRGEQGTVTLRVQVLPDGSAGPIEILRSSGYRRLDRAASDAAAKTRFTPARTLGREVESILELSYTFRLTDD